MDRKNFPRNNNSSAAQRWRWLRVVAVLALAVNVLTVISFGLGSNIAVAGAPSPATTINPTGKLGLNARPRDTNTTTYAWGYGDKGQLGNNSFAPVNNNPGQVILPSGVTGFTALAGGTRFTLGIGSDGKPYAWGYNSVGQLGSSSVVTGSSSPNYSLVPVAVNLPAGVTGFTAMSAGTNHGLGLGNDTKAYAWGDNGYGQLGNNTTDESDVPTAVSLPTGVTGFTAIAGGGSHSLAIGSDGKLYAWGDNSAGQLGNSSIPTTGNNNFSMVPVAVNLPAGVTNFTAISAGTYYSLGLGNNGKLYAWGDNSTGQLGNSSIPTGNNANAYSNVPVAVSLPMGVTGFTAFNAGFDFSMGLGNDGKLYTWGSNEYGQLGINNSSNTYITAVPMEVKLPTGVTGFSLIAAGNQHGLAVGSDGKLYAWGHNLDGQLGNNTTNDSDSSVPVAVNLPSGVLVKSVVAGEGAEHSLAIVAAAPPPPPSGGSNTYYLPLVANNANTAVGQTTTFVTFQNLAAGASANVSVQYYGLTSGTPGNTDSFTLPAKGQKAILPNVAANSSAGGIITSDQPLNVVVSEAISSGGSAYNVTGQAASTLYSPLALNGNFGFTTNITVFNAGSTTSSGTIQFYDPNGILAATQAFSINGHASQSLSQSGLSGLSNSQSYWAKITGGASDNLTAQVIELGPNNFVATFNANVVAQAAKTLYAPATFNGLYGYVTGMAFANPNAAPANVTVTYYDGSGSSAGTQTVPIAANGNASLYQGAAGTSSSIASAVIKSDQPLVMTVNERGTNNVSGTYVGIASGSTSVALPVMANGFAGFVTGTTIFNAGNAPANLTLSYLDAAGQPVGNAQTTTLAPNASYGLYQGAASQGLSSSYFGTALISSNQPLIVTTNALNTNSGLFYTYSEPNN